MTSQNQNENFPEENGGKNHNLHEEHRRTKSQALTCASISSYFLTPFTPSWRVFPRLWLFLISSTNEDL